MQRVRWAGEDDLSRYRYRIQSDIEGVMVHQLGASVGTTAPDIVKAFSDKRPGRAGSYTGGKVPYNFIVHSLGGIEQLLPLFVSGPHALKYSKPYISIACLGNFEEHGATVGQFRSAAELVAALGLWLPGDHVVCGHTEAPGSTRDKDKRCPGKFWNMDRFRAAVAEVLAESPPRETFSAMGFAFYSEINLKMHGVRFEK